MKDPENAVVRSTRATSLRAKSIAGASSATTRATAATAASKAKAITGDGEANVGKRKREALAEVTTGTNKVKAGAAGAKGKEKEGSAVKAAEPTATTTTTTRVLRRAGSAVPSRIAKPKSKDESEASSRKPLAPSKKSESKPPSSTVVYRDESETKRDEKDAADDRRAVKRSSTVVYRDETVTLPEEVDDGEARRAMKRRHMDAIVEAPQAEESQLDADKVALELTKAEESLFEPEPEVQLWDDLDADDWDDPLSVSEYVVDVCKYWKQLEVRLHFIISDLLFTLSSRSRPSRRLITWIIRPRSTGNNEEFWSTG